MTDHIFVAGGVSFDTVVQLETLPEPRQATLFARESYEVAGATSAGKALNLAALGHKVTLAAQFGADASGDFLQRRLERARINLRVLPDVQTEQHLNLMDAHGERISIFTVQRTFDPPVDVETFASTINAADAVVLDIINWSRKLIPLVKASGKELWCDLHDYDERNPYHQDYLDAADYVFLSAEALPDADRFRREHIAKGKQLVVTTHSVQGATALTRAGEVKVPSYTAFGLTDSNGAGDAFMAGYLHGHLQGQGVRRCLELGSLVAALCVASRELVHTDLTPDYLQALYGTLPESSSG